MGLVHLPRVLFLDEPSTGLDPQNRANLQELIQRLHAESGSTVVLTTHYLEEADALAGRVIVVDHGRVIADDSAAQSKSGLGDLVRLGFNEGGPRTCAPPFGCRASRTPAWRPQPETVDLRVQGRLRRWSARCSRTWPRTAYPRSGWRSPGPTLDDVFLDLTGRSLRETAVHPPGGGRPVRPIESEVAA